MGNRLSMNPNQTPSLFQNPLLQDQGNKSRPTYGNVVATCAPAADVVPVTPAADVVPVTPAADVVPVTPAGSPDHVSTMKRTLDSCTYANTPSFNYVGQTFTAKVVKVYDGDTITVAVLMHGKYWRFGVRMLGYDSPEMKSSDPVEKKWAKAAQKHLSDAIMNRMINMTCDKFDKYGRILATVECGGININQMMMDTNMCRKYDGGKKHEWVFPEHILPGETALP